MGRIHSYFYMQIKRVMKILPALLTVNLLVCGGIGIVAVQFLQNNVLAGNRQKYQMGIVGEIGESYAGLQFYVLIKNMDDSRFMIDLHRMTEKEAENALRRGQLTAYIRIPDGLVEALERGYNDKVVVEYVLPEGQEGLTGIMMNDLVGVVSTLIAHGQSTVYGMQSILTEHGKSALWHEATDRLYIRLVDMVLGRTKICSMEILGMANGLSATGYYFCSILIFFLLLLGITNSSIFTHRSGELPRLMAARGIGAVKQVAGEYLAYVCLMVFCMAGIFLVMGILLGGGSLQIAEWGRMGAEPLYGFFIKMLPIAAMLAAMQYLLYELVTGIVSGILIQFICSIAMGYLSGFFYPVSFFPDTVKRIGELLPTGIALRYADVSLAGDGSLPMCLGIFLYLLLFLGLSVMARKYRIQRG